MASNLYVDMILRESIYAVHNVNFAPVEDFFLYFQLVTI